jgi:hypothetical protein
MRRTSFFIALILMSANLALGSWAIPNNCIGTSSCTITGALNNPSTVWVVQHASYAGGVCYGIIAPTAPGLTFVSATGGAGAQEYLSSPNSCIDVYYASNTSTTSGETFTSANPGESYQIQVFEVTGGFSGTPVSAVNSVSNQTSAGGSNALTGGAVTPSQNGDLILACWIPHTYWPTAGTSPNAFTLIGTSGDSLCEYFVQSTAGAITPTAGGSGADTYAEITTASSLTALTHIRHSVKVE